MEVAGGTPGGRRGHRGGRVRRRRRRARHVRAAPAVARRGGAGPPRRPLGDGRPSTTTPTARPGPSTRTARRAARGDAVIVTLGTGIGGALVLDGRVHRGRNGMAGEFGHMQVVPDGQVCECGGTGCWEQYSSGNALVRYSRARIGVEPTLLNALCSGNPDLLVGAMVTAAAEQGDPRRLARRSTRSGTGSASAWPTWSRRSTPRSWSSAAGVSAAGDRLLDPARIALTRSLVGVGHRVVPDAAAGAAGTRGRRGRRGRPGPAGSGPAVVRHQLEGQLLEEQPDVGDDAAGLRGPAVGELGDRRRVDVDAHQRDRGRAGCCRSPPSAAWSRPSGRSRRPSSWARMARWPSITSV